MFFISLLLSYVNTYGGHLEFPINPPQKTFGRLLSRSIQQSFQYGSKLSIYM